jgi:hypothetical protein
VGALFGFGAFVAQVWTMQVTKEQMLFLDEDRQRLMLMGLRTRRLELKERSSDEG